MPNITHWPEREKIEAVEGFPLDDEAGIAAIERERFGGLPMRTSGVSPRMSFVMSQARAAIAGPIQSRSMPMTLSGPKAKPTP